MLSIEAVRTRLRDRKLQVVADETGLHYQTVYRLASGKSNRASYEVVRKLSEYLEVNP